MDRKPGTSKEIQRYPYPRGPVVHCPYCDGKHDLKLISESSGKFECMNCRETFLVKREG